MSAPLKLTLKTTRSFNKILNDWSRIYDTMANPSPFLHPSAFKIAYRYYYPYYIAKKMLPIFAVIKENDQTIAIVPMVKYYDGKLQLFGASNGFNWGGVIISELDLSEALSLLKSKFGPVEFLKIKDGDPLLDFSPIDNVTTACVEIPFANGHSAWFGSLSSSVRQNLRTSYNRLKTDGMEYTFEVFTGHTRSKLPTKEILALYCGRHEQRYGVSTSPIKRWFLEHQSFATRYYRYADNAFTTLLRINGQPAAFLSGLYNATTLTVPRLSINEDFRRYSPGMILCNETIRHLAENTTIRTLDLSQGEEQYKYKLGGIPYTLHNFKI